MQVAFCIVREWKFPVIGSVFLTIFPFTQQGVLYHYFFAYLRGEVGLAKTEMTPYFGVMESFEG